jgi:hypothetical protein
MLAIVIWSRFGAGVVEQLIKRAVGRGAIDDNHRRRVHQIAERCKTREWIVIQFSQQRVNDEGRRNNEKRIAVRRGPRDRFGAHRAAGAGAVFDDERGSAGAPDLLRHEAGDDVGYAAGRIGDDGPYRLEGLRPGAALRRNSEPRGGEPKRRQNPNRNPYRDAPPCPVSHIRLTSRCSPTI